MTLLSAEGLAVRDGAQRLAGPVDLALRPGEPLLVVGETGSGKSLLAQALMGTLPPGLSAEGEVEVGGRRLRAVDPAAFRGLWGRAFAILPQEPWLALDPLMRAGPQVAEGHRLVRGLAPRAARAAAATDLAALGLAGAGALHPHALSGGMAQRVAIAAARAGGARIVIADEPTKGLDAARRDDVAALLRDGLAEGGGLLVITHDLALARRLGGRMIVLRAGAVVESGETAALLAAPRAAYTRDLVAAEPAAWPAEAPPPPGRAPAPVVTAAGLRLARGGRLLFSDLGFAVGEGEVLGLAGPSGCGKSSLGDVLLGLLAPDAGSVRRAPGLAPTAFQKLFQDPVSAFPPRRSLRATLADTARLHGQDADAVAALLARLGLDPALLARRPGAVSGGELQRLALLRAMLARPRLLLADEPTSRLDPITQRAVIALLAGLARDEGLALVLVSHDADLLDRVARPVLRLGPAEDAPPAPALTLPSPPPPRQGRPQASR